MTNDLVALTFDNEENALKAEQALEIMRNGPYLGITETVVASRDRAGQLTIRNQWRSQAGLSDAARQVPGALTMVMLNDQFSDRLQQLAKADLDLTFAQAVATALRPGTSMLVSHIRQGGMVDVQQVLSVLHQFRGTVHHTTVPTEVEEVILSQT